METKAEEWLRRPGLIGLENEGNEEAGTSFGADLP